MNKKISKEELLSLIPEANLSNKFICWGKLNLKDFHVFDLVGTLETYNDQTEFETKESYWSKNYPIALEYFPNSGAEIYTDQTDYYLVYRDFGGHVPERRCRLIRRELIIESIDTNKPV